MTKSIFTRYITAFMAIILVAFSVLCLVLGSSMSYNAVKDKSDMASQTANTVAVMISGLISESTPDEAIEMITGEELRLKEYITLMSDYDADMVVFVVDAEGKLLICDTDAENGVILADIPQSVMDELSEGKRYSGYNDMDGVLGASYLYCASPILAGDGENVVCAVFACSASSGVRQIVANTLKILIMASLWVFLAALIAVYFITERITSPLKSMGHAAKSFSKGQFDVRVPVTGSDEVAELAKTFNTMAEDLQNMEEMRRMFLANVSHDLKTPMTTISGFIDAILVGAIPPEQQNEYLERIKSEVLRLSRLVRQLLDISRVQAGERKFEYSDFDICEMARQILFSFEQKIDEKRLEVEFDFDRDNMWTNSDKDAIHQILYNLCDNAVKFSRDKGLLKLSVHQLKDKKISVSVFNEGVGIPEEALPFVFERFYKSDKSRGMDKSGVGLGLYIAKTIINAIGEDIRVESEQDNYCRFVFTLPLAEQPNTALKHGDSD